MLVCRWPVVTAFVSVLCVFSISLSYAAGKAPEPGPGLFVYQADKITNSQSSYSSFTGQYGLPTATSNPWYVYLGGICTLYYAGKNCPSGGYCLKSGFSQQDKNGANVVLDCGYQPTSKKPSYPTQSVYDVVATFKQGWQGKSPWIQNAKVLIGIEFDPSAVTQINAGELPNKGFFSNAVAIPGADGLMFDVEGSELLTVDGQKFMERVSTDLSATQYLAIYSDAAYKVDGSTVTWNFWDALNRVNGCGGSASCQQGFWLQNTYDNTPMTYNIVSGGKGVHYSFNASLLQFPYTLKTFSSIPLDTNVYSKLKLLQKFHYQVAIAATGSSSQSVNFLATCAPTSQGGYIWGSNTGAAVPAKAAVNVVNASACSASSGSPCYILGQAPSERCDAGSDQQQYYQQVLQGQLPNDPSLSPDELKPAYLCVALAGITNYYGGVTAPTQGVASRSHGKHKSASVDAPYICKVPNTYGVNNGWPINYFNDQEFMYRDTAEGMKADGYFMGPAVYQLLPVGASQCAGVSRAPVKNQLRGSKCTLKALPQSVTVPGWKMLRTWVNDWYSGSAKYPTY